MNVFKIKKGSEENSEQGGLRGQSAHSSSLIVAIKKMLGKEKEEGTTLLSFEFLFSFLKREPLDTPS